MGQSIVEMAAVSVWRTKDSFLASVLYKNRYRLPGQARDKHKRIQLKTGDVSAGGTGRAGNDGGERLSFCLRRRQRFCGTRCRACRRPARGADKDALRRDDLWTRRAPPHAVDAGPRQTSHICVRRITSAERWALTFGERGVAAPAAAADNLVNTGMSPLTLCALSESTNL